MLGRRGVSIVAVSFALVVAVVGFTAAPASAGVGFDASVTITDGTATVVPGESTTYTIVVSNAGPGSAAGTVSFSFPGTVGAWTCVGAGGGGCTSAGAPNGPVNGAITVPGGASVTFTASVTIPPSAIAAVDATATFSVVGDLEDANDSATDTDAVTPQADLSISKTDGVTNVTPGQQVVYTVVAANAGPSNVDIVVVDVFPAALQNPAWSCIAAGGAECEAANGSGNLNNTDSAMPPGGTITYTITATVSASAAVGDTIVQTASILPLQQIDNNGANNTATDTDAVVAAQVTTTSTSTTSSSTTTTTSTNTTLAGSTTTGAVGSGALARTGSSTDGPTGLALVVLGGGLVLVGAAELRRRRANVG